MNKKSWFALLLVFAAGFAYWNQQADYAQGWVPDPQATQQFINANGPKAYLDGAAPHLFGDDTTQNVLLYRAVQKVKPGHFPLNQKNIGSCVSFGTGACIDILIAIQVEQGISDTFLPAAEESIYGGARCQAWNKSFAGYGDGASGIGAAKWSMGWGIVFRKPYPQYNIDLSTYSVDLCKEWGAYGSGGKNYRQQFDLIARQHPVRQVAIVRNSKEAIAALKSGYPINVCSGQGFSRYRNADGYSEASGSWSHSMCICGWREDKRYFLILNSWDKWNSGGKWPEDQPDGSFWASEAVVNRMLGGNDSYAYSDAVGFPKKKLSHSLNW